jgi:hypothetical protein
MTHLTREELQRWWERGLAADRDRVVGHLAECDECGRLYADVIDAQPVDAADAPALEPAVVARAYRAVSSGAATSRAWSARSLAAYAAAAAVVLAVSIPAWRIAIERWGGDDGTIRGTSLLALEPSGTAGRPIRFRWASPIDAPSYRIEVRDAQQGLVLTLPTMVLELTLTPDQAGTLLPGRVYTWQVVAATVEGDEIMRSQTLTFSVPAPRP